MLSEYMQAGPELEVKIHVVKGGGELQHVAIDTAQALRELCPDTVWSRQVAG